MSNSIKEHSHQANENVDARLRQEEEVMQKALLGGQARSVAGLQKHEKDVILPSNSQGRAVVCQSGKNELSSKPKLSGPSIDWNGLQDVGEHEEGLISIIGSVLSLQAKTSSEFWSTLWKQASSSMMMQVKFAPVIGQAIEDAGKAQSNTTLAQAGMSNRTGWISIAAFGGTMLLGLKQEYENPTEEMSKDDTFLTENETPKISEEPQMPETDPTTGERAAEPATTTASVEQNMETTVNKMNNKKLERLKTAKKGLKNSFGKASSFFGHAFIKALNTANSIGMISQGMSGIVSSSYQTEQAKQQEAEGEANALSKKAEVYSQFCGQDFSRTNDLTQGASQYIDNAMNILKSAADTITQTVASMFRG